MVVITTRDGIEIEDEHATTKEIVEDIRHRIRYAPETIGADRRALPPVDWARVAADKAADEEWNQQFEDDVKSGRWKNDIEGFHRHHG